jgi:5'-deoxynucleotidase YfbR-like HD superfamily hydrolase
MKLVDMLRLSFVDRFQTVSISRRQSVAEHSFNVAVIAGQIAKRMKSVPVTTIMAYAVTHDLEEAILGDIPSPTKVRLQQAGLNYSKAKRKIIDDDLIDKGVKIVVKAADQIEMLYYFAQYGNGNHYEIRLKSMEEIYSEWKTHQHKDLQRAMDEVRNELKNQEWTI